MNTQLSHDPMVWMYVNTAHISALWQKKNVWEYGGGGAF